MIHYFFNLLSILIIAVVSSSTPNSEIAGNTKDNERREAGRKIYNYRCYFCHGYSGNAKTLTSTFVNPPPRDFTNTTVNQLQRDTMLEAVTNGRPNTAMHGFSRLLNSKEIERVVDFVREEFMTQKKENTKYHTVENGWANHDRYQSAYPFAKGSIPLDTPWEELSQSQKIGKKLFMSSCVSCHDRAIVVKEGPIWSSQSISYPRNNFSYSDIDIWSGASIYAIHDRLPQIPELSKQAQAGQQLWQQNCAFCHAADGTGKNWIGSFLEPKPRNLTNPNFMSNINREYLSHSIRKGLANTSMPAWENVLSEKQTKQIIQYISEAFHKVN